MCSELLNIGHTSPVTVSLPLLNQIPAEATLYIKDYYIQSASKQTLLNSPFIMPFREKKIHKKHAWIFASILVSA